jgi:undecaprenyl-diphosphatase
VLLGVASVGLLGLALLIVAVRAGATRAFDEALLLALRTSGDLATPIGPEWIERALRDLTSLGSPASVTLITALAIGYCLLRRQFGAAALALVAIGGAGLANDVVKGLIGRARPEIVPHLADVQTLSFPSGHAALSAATCLTLAALLARGQGSRTVRLYVRAVALFIALLIGCSRVYLGVHWPTDVLAGWCLGSAWAALCSTSGAFMARRWGGR